MKKYLVALGLCIFSLNVHATKKMPTKAPVVLVTKDFGCGNLECCHFDMDWKVEKSADVMSAPGKGKKLETLAANSEIRPLESHNFTTRGVIKLSVDKAGGKAGQEYYYYNKDSSQGFELYSKSGEQVMSPSGYDFISVDMMKPECKTNECVGTIVTPSKGNTYVKVKTKKNNTGWVNLVALEPSC